MEEPKPWHRLFGLTWEDFFHGTPVVVEREKDLSVQQQLLDVLILRREPGPIGRTMPDGMADLAAHNLITFKSRHEALDEWALCELVSHFVAYRKLASPTTSDLLPVGDFRLFAVSGRSPSGLTGRVVMDRVSDGVYDVPFFLGPIRVVVANELPLEPRNALVQVFGVSAEVTRFGARNFEIRSPATCSLLREMIKEFREEGPEMAEAMEELTRRLKDEFLDLATPDELRARLTPEQRLEGLSIEEIIAALPPELQEAVRRAKKAE